MSSGLDSWLWALDKSGCPHRIRCTQSDPNASECQWTAKPCRIDGVTIRLRRISCVAGALWAIGNDGGAYLWVDSSQIAIRQSQEIYENQRWYPLFGWKGGTLPTDRPGWSTADGDRLPAAERIVKLPSAGWKWDEWFHPDLSQTAYDKEGWQYASVNFCQKFGNRSLFDSLVRRRRWVAYRSYAATDKWIRVSSSPHLIDVSAGSMSRLSSAEEWRSVVWAISRSGQLLFRDGVSQSPDGIRWSPVDGVVSNDGDDTSADEELLSLSCCASTGRLWVLTWDGRLFNRDGISASNPTGVLGKKWTELQRPKGLPILTMTLGRFIAWALTSEGKLYNIKLDPNDITALRSEHWIEMPQAMNRISMARDDHQMFAVNGDERLFVRCGISLKEPLGQSWKSMLLVPPKVSEPSLDDYGGFRADVSDNLTLLPEGFRAFLSTSVSQRTKSEKSKTAETSDSVSFQSLSQQETQSTVDANSEESLTKAEGDIGRKELRSTKSDGSIEEDSPTMEVAIEAVSLTLDTEVLFEPLDSCYTPTSEHQWLDVSAGSCLEIGPLPRFWTDPTCSVNHFGLNQSLPPPRYSEADVYAPWRQTILSGLIDRNRCIEGAFADFVAMSGNEVTVADEDTFKKTAKCLVKTAGDSRFRHASIDCVFPHGRRLNDEESDRYWLSIRYRNSVQSVAFPVQRLLAALPRCLRYCSEQQHYYAIEVFTTTEETNTVKDLAGGRPLILAFVSESERDSWLNFFTDTLALRFPAHFSRCQWLITTNDQGGVAVGRLNEKRKPRDWRFLPVPGHFKSVVARVGDKQNNTAAQIEAWALAFDGSLWRLSPQFSIRSPLRSVGLRQSECVSETVWEHQRMSPIFGYVTFTGLLHGCPPWADITRIQRLTKDEVKLPGKDWTWTGDWCIDEKNGEVDQEGWQYGRSLKEGSQWYPCQPSSLRRQPVRRRRWVRSRRASLAAPWLPVATPAPLAHIALQDNAYPSLWVVTSRGGEVLCGSVDSLASAAPQWRQLLCDRRVRSVSVSTEGEDGPLSLWALTEDSSLILLKHSSDPQQIFNCGWHELLPPSAKECGGSSVSAVSASPGGVFVRTEEGRLFRRDGITAATPDGKKWTYAYADVRHAVAITPSPSTKETDGETIVALLNGKTPCGSVTGMLAQKSGDSWDYGIVGNFTTLTIAQSKLGDLI